MKSILIIYIKSYFKIVCNEYDYDIFLRIIGEKISKVGEVSANIGKLVEERERLSDFVADGGTGEVFDLDVKLEKEKIIYTYNAVNKLITATISEGNNVTIES